MGHSRRDFLTQISSVAAVGVLGQIPVKRLRTLTPLECFPELDEAKLRGLAVTAIDAARSAGAEFADINIFAARSYTIMGLYTLATKQPPSVLPLTTMAPISYSVRAIKSGVWGFANGSGLSTDAVVQTARAAVGAAGANPARHRERLELAPAPKVTGRWATPVEQDPLLVPINEQVELAVATLGNVASIKEVSGANVTLQWRCPTEIYARSDGSLITQRFTESFCRAGVTVAVGPEPWQAVDVDVPMPVGGYGYELARAKTLVNDLREAALQALPKARQAKELVAQSVDVGRYDIVFGSHAVASLVTETLAESLFAERALGFTANEEGTSFAAPPSEMLGRYQAASPLFTVRGDRTQPGGLATVKWDKEGVPPDEYTFIKDGVITDYHTDRQTAQELAACSQKRREPLRSHGTARRTSAMRHALIPNMTVEPGRDTTTVDELIADTKRGYFIENAQFGSVDQQVISAQYSVRPESVREIRNGKLYGYMKDFAFQFITTPFWKSVDAIGSPASAESHAVLTDYIAQNSGLLPFTRSTVRAVPMRARQVNVLNTGRSA